MFTVHASATQSQLVLLVTYAARLVLSIVLTALFGRYLAPSEFGFLSLLAIIFIFSGILSDLGTTDLGLREISRQPQREHQVLQCLLALRGIVGTLLGLLCLLLALLQAEPLQRNVLLVVALLLPFLALNAMQAVFTVRQRQWPPALLALCLQLATLLACMLMLDSSDSIVPLVVIILAREAIFLVGLRLLATRTLGYQPMPVLQREVLRSLMPAVYAIGAATVCYGLIFHIGTFFIWQLLPADALGAYAAAFRLFLPFLTLPALLAGPIIPVWTQLVSHDRAAYQLQLNALVPAALGLAGIVVALCYTMGADVLRLVYGDRFIAGELAAITSLRWLGLAFACTLVIPLLVTRLLAEQQEKLLFPLAFTGMLTTVLLCLALVYTDGINGAATATALGEVVVLTGGLLLGWRSSNFRLLLQRLVLACIPGVLLYIAGMLLPAEFALKIPMLLALAVGAAVALVLLPDLTAAWRSLQDSRHNLAG